MGPDLTGLTVMGVPLRSTPDPTGRCRVVIVGGGVAGLEALVALRTLAGERVELALIAPEREFAYRPLTVVRAFGAAPGPSIDITELAQTVGARHTVDSLAGVDRTENTLRFQSGASLGYDVLLLATGARAEEALAGAVTFGAPHGTQRFQRVLAELESGHISRVVFAVPEKSGWPLGLYELALLTADRLRARGITAELTLLTPEPAPLAVFGGRASGAVLEDLEERGIHFIAGAYPDQLARGELIARPGHLRIKADAVVTLPRLSGPRIPGIPCDEAGYIPVDAHGVVRGMSDVYAAGDAIAFPVKYGGLAALQAVAAAESIAASVGAAVVPAPFRPVLRGMLLAGSQTRYLEAIPAQPLRGSTEIAVVESGTASLRPLWWPPAKLAGRYLAPYLSGQVTVAPMPPQGVPVQVTIDTSMPAGGGIA